jgi:hypothetical protein
MDVIVQFLTPPSKQDLAGFGNLKKTLTGINGAVVRLKGAAAKNSQRIPTCGM